MAVPCHCGIKTCFECNGESHAPASCIQLREWKIREAGESDNLAYITSHTKPCPTCSTPIEKNEGCMHMTCTRCKSDGKPKDWCWICGEVWDFQGRHGNNWFNPPCKDDSKVKEGTQQRERVETELFHYIKYYEGYAEHEKNRRFQITKDIEKAQAHKERIQRSNPGADSDYVIRAVQSLIEARTYLKFTYVYGYYLPEQHKDFFDWKVKGVEKVISTLSNMLEDIYRHDLDSPDPQPYSRDQLVDTAAMLKWQTEDVMQGLKDMGVQS
eukprot:NODE_1378_length_1528_cov_13.167737_g1305_i0.p2 GENE.NODE_1378_length_1528_cov_13.167737_g1305_i0~~NODE_1378_length_1528_cov_13.167737_g1305_i0.p2  ORF type:complete len:269 (+),score=66.04 NODE_1378_length_1528_cov_13.167737_g1305_i0:679-1485(+)